jgi:uncharacterized damage-inducible protein DinB
MRSVGWFCVLALGAGLAVNAAGQQTIGEEGASISKIFDQQLSGLERGFVSLAEAMPEGRYGFAPEGGEFAGVRTFGQQAAHTAAVIYLCAASVLNEQPPVDTSGQNGPASLKTKDDIVKYLKNAFAYGRKAMATLKDESFTAQVRSPFGRGTVTRASMVSAMLWHSYDHYGQMVVYLRMNGMVPPASRR